ncbi:flavocytochrome c [Snodgrassella communis]|uniref:Fumarate reductase flavoprotein subunit n=1 Tax=Snodgrassella communis TaxID=2946699 RepID=A0A836Z536_9NEIS|nr:flavocytochrome c [Snodgrassella communis]KDN14786.1 Fumarate reductase flavoprotein subunit [Snodgrassella communis]PIT07502.1 flavocytochrome c [Snodgrassella communis]PIT28092.1 flavocytochrome c [Snodgrassella communis]PIT30186.1 flavocytochrome c [Snodgrassella communis]PIT37957.1 flavocytochrome c [Snodgrassella communis]
MTNPSSPLFNPITLPNGVVLKNRLVMAPMTTCCGFYDGSVTDNLINYYRERSGSIGTVIVECGYVDALGPAFPGAIGIHNDDCIEGLSLLAAAIKERGSKAVIQIYHGGRMVEPQLIGGQTPIGPSAIAIPRPNATVPVAMTAGEVEDMIGKFGEATRRAIAAGFDGIEIHGANTYLIQQFFSPHANQRQDKWGGSRENRTRFPLAVLEVSRQMAQKHATNEFIIGYRFSPEELEVPGITFDDSLFLLDKLAQVGLDYVHFSMAATLRSSIIDTSNKTPLIDKYMQLRSTTLAKIPVIGVGNVVNRADAEAAMAHGYDLVAAGRACVAYPDWTERIQNQNDLQLSINSDQRAKLSIPEPLWRFPLIYSMVREINTKKFHAGSYQQTVNDDFDNTFVINVELGQDFIKDLSLVNAEQLDHVSVRNFYEIKERILAANSPYVDAISGATSQCDAFKKAVTKAISTSYKVATIVEGGDADDKSCDVVVVGSGGAGLAAAIEAHDKGASVIIVEKMPITGGNTNKASAGMNAAETRFQQQAGIIDHKEWFYNETLKGGKNKNNPQLLHYFVEHAPAAIDWLDEKGIQLNNLTTTGGMSVDRTHRPSSGAAVGGFLISGLLKNINDRGIEVMLDTSVTEIEMKDGRVNAVMVCDEEGTEQRISTKAVIVATGGFGANAQMVTHYRPDLADFVTTNHKGATGSGIALLQKIGAGTVDMNEIQIHPTVEQNTAYLISESIRGGGAILISQQGKRFVNELDTRDKVSNSIIALPEHYAYILFDEQICTQNKAAETYIGKGLAVQAATLAELADKLAIDPESLINTVERYNQYVKQQHDEDFGRTTGMRHPLNQPSFYAIQIAPGIHHTMGGITINTNTEVLDTNAQIIKGVYAAGEVTGGVHGGNRIGGNAIADIIIFGIQAGDQAAAYAKKH